MQSAIAPQGPVNERPMSVSDVNPTTSSVHDNKNRTEIAGGKKRSGEGGR